MLLKLWLREERINCKRFYIALYTKIIYRPTEYTQEISAASFGENSFVPANVEISKDKSKSAHETSAKG